MIHSVGLVQVGALNVIAEVVEVGQVVTASSATGEIVIVLKGLRVWRRVAHVAELCQAMCPTVYPATCATPLESLVRQRYSAG